MTPIEAALILVQLLHAPTESSITNSIDQQLNADFMDFISEVNAVNRLLHISESRNIHTSSPIRQTLKEQRTLKALTLTYAPKKRIHRKQRKYAH